MGCSKLHPTKHWAHLGSLDHGPKMGVQICTPRSGPIWGQLPIRGFWAPESQLMLLGWGGDRQMAIVWDREGWIPAACIIGRRVWKGPPYVFWGGPLPKKRVALRASPGLVARRLAAMLVCLRLI